MARALLQTRIGNTPGTLPVYMPMAMMGVGSTTAGAGQSTTEANAQLTMRQAGQIADMAARFTTAPSGGTVTIKSRKNAADGTLAISVATGLSGDFSDTTHQDTVTAADKFNYYMTVSAGTFGTIQAISVSFIATTNHATVYATSLDFKFGTITSGSQWFPLTAGALETANTVETDMRFKVKKAVTAKFLFVNVNTNQRATATTVKTRKNIGNGTMTVSITASTTGIFEDTTHTDSLALNDTVNLEINTGTGANTLFLNALFAVTFVNSVDMTSEAIWSSAAGVGRAASATVHYPGLTYQANLAIVNETNVQGKVPMLGSLSNMRLYTGTNTTTGACTLKSRVNNADGVQTISITAATTGWFEDTTHTDNFSPYDIINYSLTGGTSGTLTVHMIGMLILTKTTLPLTTAAINATSTASGSIRIATKAITPAAITATSTAAGSLGVIRAVLPVTINATSTTAGGLRVIRGILPTTINATSTVSALLPTIHAVKPAVINATSTTTGKVAATKLIKPVTVLATATVSGKVVAIRIVIPTSINATSTTSGAIVVVRRIPTAAVAATSTVSGAIVVIRRVFPTTINATSTTAGSIIAARGVFPAVIFATSTASGRVVAIRPFLVTTINATSTTTGAVVARRPVVPGAITAMSIVSGLVVAIRRVFPTTIMSVTSVSGFVTVLRGTISGVIAATSTLVGHLLRALRGSVVNATSTVGASLIAKRVVRGNIFATSVIVGDLANIVLFDNVHINATSTVNAPFAVIRAIKPFTIYAQSSINGAVPTIHILGGDITSTTTISGRIGRIVHFGNVIVSNTTVTGKVVRIVHYNGEISAPSTVRGSLGRVRHFGNNIYAISTVVGGVRPIASGVIYRPSGHIVRAPSMRIAPKATSGVVQ